MQRQPSRACETPTLALLAALFHLQPQVSATCSAASMPDNQHPIDSRSSRLTVVYSIWSSCCLMSACSPLTTFHNMPTIRTSAPHKT